MTDNNQSSILPHRYGFFMDDKGDYSMMRLMSFLALLTSISLGIWTVFGSTDQNKAKIEAGENITRDFLVSAFGGKATQKMVELLQKRKNNSDT
jgi:hypothetical protein